MKLENIIRSSWKFNFSIVLCVYLIAHLLMLLSNGVWWDDFVVWNVTPESLYGYLGPGDANEPFQYAYIRLVTDWFPLNQQVYVFHFISFLIHGISLVCCWFIIKELTSDLSFTTMCSMLIAVFGFDTTSMLIVCTHYTVANCLFFVGLLMCVLESRTNKQYLLFFTGITWLLSVLVWRSAALLMPFCILTLAFAKSHSSWRTLKGWIDAIKYVFIHYWPIVAIVALFFPCYIAFLRPSNAHAAYYSPHINSILSSPVSAFISAGLAIIAVIGESIKALFVDDCLILTTIAILLVGVVYAYVHHLKDVRVEKANIYKSLSVIAFLFLMVSMILPLWIGDFFELLDMSEYKSRILNLGAFPISIILVYLLTLMPIKVRNIIFSLVFVGSMIYTVFSCIDYAYAFHKSEIIADYLEQHPELEGANIYIIDNSYEANENESCLRFYVYEGMARMAYGRDTKTRFESSFREYYGSKLMPDYILRCSTTHLPITRQEKCKLVMSKGIFKRKHKRLKGEMLNIELEKLK